MRRCPFKNENGLTLVEVLAALVILGILFVGIMTIFPQMTLFNARTETKLDTMNLARQEMAEITDAEKWVGSRDPMDPSITEEFEEKASEEMAELGYTLDAVNSDPLYERYKKIGDYLYEADIYLQCEPYLAEQQTEAIPCDDPQLDQLHKIHLKVYDGDRLSSETFSYISYRIESQVR